MNLFKRKKNLGESTLTVRMWEFTGSAILNLFIFMVLAVYLSPLLYMLATSLKEPAQQQDSNAPLYPAINPLYNYNGKIRSIYKVPTKDGMKEWALVTPHRTSAEFVDPQNPDAGLIHWDGNWRQLEKTYRFDISVTAFTDLWKQAHIPEVMANTFWVGLISEIGVLLSSIAVAYGFSRFRIPGGKWLFFLLIATILIPGSITLVPTYITFTKLLNWLPSLPFAQLIATGIWPKLVEIMGFLHIPIPASTPWQWLPLIAPHFFSSAIFVFLLRQNFKSIPRDLDEAAMLDGAGPLRILIQIIIPQSVPAIATVALLHFFYIWNELRTAALYLGTRPDLRTISFNIQSVQTRSFTPEVLQAGALLLLIVPVVILFLFQRFFMNDMVVTGLEK
jgi:multiple sugar transport system permease protein